MTLSPSPMIMNPSETEDRVDRNYRAVALPPMNSSEIDDEIARSYAAIADKARAIINAEAEHASLVTEDAKLVAAINENRRLAAIPEPKAADFARLDEWHSAARKWNAGRGRLDGALPALEVDRNRQIVTVAAAMRQIAELRVDLAQLELDAATVQKMIAEQVAKWWAGQVNLFHRALLTAREAF